MKLTNCFTGDSRRIKTLLSANAEAVRQSNAAMLKRVLLIGLLISTFALLCGIIRPDMRHAVPGYLTCIVVFSGLMAFFHGKRLETYALVGLYLLITMFFIIALYLSCFVFRERYAATALTFFCAASLVFVDKSEQTTAYILALYLVHTAAAFAVKEPSIAGVDAVNCLISMVLSLSLSRVMLRDRLESFEAMRLLKQERETDVLTALFNRRKLFDTLADIEGGAECPAGVLMLDIDRFKRFNDSYGHAAGDECLHNFGALLRGFEQMHRSCFYRYGGEEFVALVYDCDRAELMHIAEGIRAAAQKRSMGADYITVSIGVAACDGTIQRNYEYWIGKADEAAYAAKSMGRNCVVCYENDNR